MSIEIPRPGHNLAARVPAPGPAPAQAPAPAPAPAPGPGPAPAPIGTVSFKLFYIIIDELLDLFNAFHISFTFLWCGSSSC